MAARIGELIVSIGSDISSLTAGLNSATKETESFGKKFSSISSNIGKAGALAFAAVGAATAALVTKQMSLIGNLADTAAALDVATSKLQTYRFITEQNGGTSDQLDMSLRKMNRALGDIAQGNGANATKALEALGIKFEDISSLRSDEQFEIIGRSLGEIDNTAQRAALSAAFFGKNTQAIDLTLRDLNNGSLADATKHLSELGILLSDIDAAKVESAGDAVERLGGISQGIGNQIAVALAPYLEGISNSLVEAAKNGTNFGTILGGVFNAAAAVVGLFADGLRGINIIIKGLAIPLQGFALAAVKAFEGATTIISTAIDGWIMMLNELIKQANKAPGIELDLVPLTGESEFMNSVRETSRQATDEMAKSNQELLDLLAKPLPSDNIKNWIAEVEAASQKAAEATVLNRENQDRTGAVAPNKEAELKAKTDREDLERKLEAIRESAMSEQEILLKKQKEEQDALASALEAQLLTKEEFKKLELAQEQKHYDELLTLKETKSAEQAEIEGRIRAEADKAKKKADDDELEAKRNFYDNLQSAATGSSRALFNIGKVAAIANAVRDGISATLSAYRAGNAIGGPPVGATFAAAAAAKSAVMISKIKSTSFGGGGGGNASAGGGSVPNTPDNRNSPFPGQDPSQGGQNVNITLNGDSFSKDSVKALFDQINSGIKQGRRINLT